MVALHFHTAAAGVNSLAANAMLWNGNGEFTRVAVAVYRYISASAVFKYHNGVPSSGQTFVPNMRVVAKLSVCGMVASDQRGEQNQQTKRDQLLHRLPPLTDTGLFAGQSKHCSAP